MSVDGHQAVSYNAAIEWMPGDGAICDVRAKSGPIFTYIGAPGCHQFHLIVIRCEIALNGIKKMASYLKISGSCGSKFIM